MAKESYVMCTMERPTETGKWVTTGYIEQRGAKVGNKVELVDLDGKFWNVVGVSKDAVSKDFVRARSRDYKTSQGSLKGGGIDA